MDRQRARQLTARFIAEAEADIYYGLAEGLDPRHEYSMLVARLRGEESPRGEVESEVLSVGDLTTDRDGLETPELQLLAESMTGLNHR